jgi:hypothetical protein
MPSLRVSILLAFIAIIVSFAIYKLVRLYQRQKKHPPALCKTDKDCADGKKCDSSGQCRAAGVMS